MFWLVQFVASGNAAAAADSQKILRRTCIVVNYLRLSNGFPQTVEGLRSSFGLRESKTLSNLELT